MTETLSDLVTARLGKESRNAWFARTGFPRRTFNELAAGYVRTPQAGTVIRLVLALGLKLTEQNRQRVLDAIEASRLAATTT